MQVLTLQTNSPLGNLNYLIWGPQQKVCYVIDPFDSEQILQQTRQLGAEKVIILLTHTHFDHIAGVSDLVGKEGFPVWGHPLCRQAGIELQRELTESDLVELSSGSLEVLEVPGHKKEHIVFRGQVEGEEDFLIAGDTLFFAGVGNCKNGGDPVELYHSIQKLKRILSPKTVIYPGHDYLATNLAFCLSVAPSNVYAKQCLNKLEEGKILVPTKFEQELKFNPFLRLDDQEIVQSTGGEETSEQDRFVALRAMRDQW